MGKVKVESMTREEIQQHKEPQDSKKHAKVLRRQKKYIQMRKTPKYVCDNEHPRCCIECLDKTFNVDDSIECCFTYETVFNPFDEVGKQCPKKG